MTILEAPERRAQTVARLRAALDDLTKFVKKEFDLDVTVNEPTHMKKFVIKSESRNLYFVAFHSFTPMFGTKDKAKRFDTLRAADNYASEELFTTRAAYTIEDAL